MVILDYVTNEDERRAIQKVTNMVEDYNRFNDWFVIGERSVIRDNDPDEFEKRVKYSDLNVARNTPPPLGGWPLRGCCGAIANCAILQNVVDLTRIFKDLMDQGYTVSREARGHPANHALFDAPHQALWRLCDRSFPAVYHHRRGHAFARFPHERSIPIQNGKNYAHSRFSPYGLSTNALSAASPAASVTEA